MPVKIYTQESLLIQEHRKHIFFIFLELSFTHKEWIRDYFELSAQPRPADYFVWPLCLSYTRRIGEYQSYLNFIKEADAQQKKVWVYTGGDEGWSQFKQPQRLVHFRLAGFKSSYNLPTEVLPTFIQDPLADKELNIIKNPLPPYRLGFVGHADGSLRKWVKEVLLYLKKQVKRISRDNIDFQSFYPSSVRRFYYLEKLGYLKNLKTDYILRRQYRAAATSDLVRRKATEEEFKENIKDNLFTFCMRGGGNFSVRFYETLAQGRIPLYLETDTQLPLTDKINWDNHFLRLYPKDTVSEIEFKLTAFIKANDLEALQLKNRNLWENYLTREAYAKHLFLKYRSE
ncbi:hypothetical protein G3567_07190 [Psychroflexus sp. YR1-1]|uniref:Exostosin family protein n=1 Tax=Psychroflexus aurantiacus TaxID=2709310 RepID=A0A6B3R086_9FLAO|nr:hypothetical protein [Psychroflexus aurantiacus]NEV93929.1 hypothetical protein [Psychroflexus aurantiacus]